MKARAAATTFINTHFTIADCRAAFLAGSVVRDEATFTSDLDIVVVTTGVAAPYRESLVAHGWPIGLFVHTPDSWQQFFARDAERRRPTLPMMCAEGVMLINQDGCADQIRQEARLLLARGPEPLSEPELASLRYRVTEQLDDLTGADDYAEQVFIVPELLSATLELILSHNRQWCGRGKWAWRMLQRYNETLAETLLLALKAFHQTGSRSGLVTFIESSLEDAGGRLFDGYSVGKTDSLTEAPDAGAETEECGE